MKNFRSFHLLKWKKIKFSGQIKQKLVVLFDLQLVTVTYISRHEPNFLIIPLHHLKVHQINNKLKNTSWRYFLLKNTSLFFTHNSFHRCPHIHVTLRHDLHWTCDQPHSSFVNHEGLLRKWYLTFSKESKDSKTAGESLKKSQDINVIFIWNYEGHKICLRKKERLTAYTPVKVIFKVPGKAWSEKIKGAVTRDQSVLAYVSLAATFGKYRFYLTFNIEDPAKIVKGTGKHVFARVLTAWQFSNRVSSEKIYLKVSLEE